MTIAALLALILKRKATLDILMDVVRNGYGS
jgi:hypothetical protein